jgi:hypothetical protein
MKRIAFSLAFLMALIALRLESIAQVETLTDSTVNRLDSIKSYSLVGMVYNSDIVFLGRKSPIKSPYLSVSAGYYHKSGLFINGIISYLATSGGKRIDLFTASGGYDYYKSNFTAGISGTGYVFNNKSYTAKSALTGNLNVYADYNFDIVEVYLDGTAYFSNQSDFIFSAAVSHNFYSDNGNLKISPAFSLYGGTQNYYSNYNNNLQFGRHMNNNGSPASMGMMGGGFFNMLNYEFSVPVTYGVKSFQFIFFPVYAIPVNSATITDNQNTYKEDLANNFFWSLGVSYKISKHKK